MKVTVHYFAVLRESAGVRSEVRDTQAGTARELYDELRGAYAFPLGFDQVRVAVGTAYADADTPLTEGLELTFIPPVAGG